MGTVSAPENTGASACGAHPLAGLFAPRAIAIVGASATSPWTQLTLSGLHGYGYEGAVYCVSRSAASVGGYPGFPSCQAIGRPVDVAFLCVPQDGVLAALDDAAAAGIRNAVVLSSGYAEVGGAGIDAQAALLAHARALGMRLWGPNTLGFNNIAARASVSAIPAVLPVLSPALLPAIAIVSQSGATASELYEFAHSQNIATSFVAATGNQGDITLSDVIDYLVDDPQTRAIAVFAETIRDPAAFVAACTRALAQAKPIVMLKIGRSELAGAVAMAHTGSLIGDDRVFSAVCERLGIVRVFSGEALITTAGLLAATGALARPGLAFMSISGGACTLVADGAEAAGVTLPAYDGPTRAALAEALPGFAAGLNPLDITGAAVRDPGLFERVIPLVAGAADVGLVAVGMTVPNGAGQGLPDALAAIGRAVAVTETPVVLVQTCMKALNDISREAIADNGLPPVITGIEAMLHAVGRAMWWSARTRAAPPALLLAAPPAHPTDRLASERAVLDALAAAGVPVIPATVATSRAAAEAFAAGQTAPLVLKVLSPDIAHKTEVGGVRLDVPPDQAGAAYDALLRAVRTARPAARIEGVILSPMRRGGLELLVSVSSDATWGPVLTVGLGGVLVEVLADAVVAPLPVTRADVADMLGRLRGARLLRGFRGAPPADLDRLADVIVAIAAAAVRLGPGLASLEVNPLRVDGATVEALDGLVVWQDAEETHEH